MRGEHKQTIERESLTTPNALQVAKQRAMAWLEQIRNLYGDRIERVEQAELHELFAAFHEVAYVINVWVELPDSTPICLADGYLVAYE